MINRVACALCVALCVTGLGACRRLLDVQPDPNATPVTPPTQPSPTPPESLERSAQRAPRRARHPTETLSVQCGAESMTIDAPTTWRATAGSDSEVRHRWALGDGADGPWVIVRCASAARSGFREIDALYRRFTTAQGAAHPRVGSGYAGIGQVSGMRSIRVEAEGTLVQPVEGVELTLPAQAMQVQTRIIEARGGAVVFEIVGRQGALVPWLAAFDAMVESVRSDGQALAIRREARLRAAGPAT